MATPLTNMMEPSRRIIRNTAPACAECHADADLTRASRHRISFDSIETNYCQTKCESAKDGKQSRARANKPKIKIRIKMLSEGSQRKDWE